MPCMWKIEMKIMRMVATGKKAGVKRWREDRRCVAK